MNKFDIQTIKENNKSNKDKQIDISNNNNNKNKNNNLNLFSVKQNDRNRNKNKNAKEILLMKNEIINKNDNSNYQGNQNINYEIEINKIKQLFSSQLSEILFCFSDFKEKISDIIKLSKQLKNQYDFIITNYPNLDGIIITIKKSFFLLHFIATSEIVNNLTISHHYIFQRFNILSDIINQLEKKPNLLLEEINEIKYLKLNIQNIIIKAQKNYTEFGESMGRFLESFYYI